MMSLCFPVKAIAHEPLVRVSLELRMNHVRPVIALRVFTVTLGLLGSILSLPMLSLP